MLNLDILQIMIQISELVLFITLIVLAIYLIINIKKIATSVSVISAEVKELSNEITPLVSDISILVKDIQKISDKTSDQISKLESVVNAAADKTYEILNYINKFQGSINSYVENGFNFFSAVKKGVSVFAHKIKEKTYLNFRDKNYYNKKVI